MGLWKYHFFIAPKNYLYHKDLTKFKLQYCTYCLTSSIEKWLVTLATIPRVVGSFQTVTNIRVTNSCVYSVSGCTFYIIKNKKIT